MWFTSSLSAVLIGLFPFPPCLLSQESCARVLLFRGASKEIRNYNSQTAFQVRRRAPGPVPPAELLGGPGEGSFMDRAIGSGCLC